MTQLWPLLLLTGLACSACSKAPDTSASVSPTVGAKRPATQITTTQAKIGVIEQTEATLGVIEATDDPRMAAEIAGRITLVPVGSGQFVKRGQLLAEIDPADPQIQNDVDQAEITRLTTLLTQQERVVSRQSELLSKNFVSRHALDDAVSQRDALKSQLLAAENRARLSGRSIGKSRVSAPHDGIIDEVLVARGDFVKVGDPMFRLIGKTLRANLPFSEALGGKLKIGQAVQLSSPLTGGAVFEARIDELRPQLTDAGRQVLVQVRLKPDPRLKAGATVNARVMITRRDGAVLVPEQSVVLRPAGKVVYAVVEGKANQRVIETGTQENGMIEVLQGLKAGETVALDGAGFLSQGAEVVVKAPPATKAASVPPPSPDKKPQ